MHVDLADNKSVGKHASLDRERESESTSIMSPISRGGMSGSNGADAAANSLLTTPKSIIKL